MIHVPLSFPSGSAGSDLSVNHAISAFAALSSTHPEVTHIDVVIANAGTSSPRVPILDVTPDRLLGSLAVNSLAPLLLFQAAWPLLQKADNPKFVAIGSIVGSVVGVEETGGWADAAYGTSKAAGNYLVRKLGKEMEEAVAVCVVHPGWIQTDMGNARAVEQGLKEAPVTLKESVEGIFEEIDRMGKGKDCGFRTFDHKDIAW
ncbi:MAG: hypothetical protein M1834_003133 [Cirrosporium novae-zelandiae]|nr:MAG: hypothetical protein M1834_003133 [Cirrosporium novae-zelandiae]